jgi:hypothetical protein
LGCLVWTALFLLDWRFFGKLRLSNSQQGKADMLSSAALALLFVAYLALIAGPRLYLVLFGRRCPCCETGKATFQGLAEHPWHRLRSAWSCGNCETELREARWGRLEIVTPE